MANDPYWNNTKLLLTADDPVDSFASSTVLSMMCANDAVAEIGTVVKGSSAVYYMGGDGIGYYTLDGTPNDYNMKVTVTAPSSNLFDTGDMTVECWVYIIALPDIPAHRNILTAWKSSGDTYTQDFWLALYWTGSQHQLQTKIRGSTLTYTYTFPLNTWTHVAVSTQGADAKVFINGVAVTAYSGVQLGPWDTLTNGIRVGYSGITSPAATMRGLIGDVRVTRACKYWNTFTPARPLPIPTPYRDVANGRKATSVGSALLPYSGDYKFGGACVNLDGAGYVSFPAASEFSFGTGDFTIELFAKRNTGGAAAQKVLFGNWNSANNNGCALIVDTDDTIGFVAVHADSSASHLTSSAVLSTTNWEHIAVSRNAGTLRLFRDGLLIASRSDVATKSFGNATNLQCVGKHASASTNYFVGLIDEIRVTGGVGRYTAEFSPPTLPHPQANTVVSGVVRDSNNALCSRLVRVHSRLTGRVLGEQMSNPTTGAFSIGASEACYAVVFDSTGSYNAIILDKLDPLV